MEVIALPQRKTTSRRKKPIYVPMVGANAVRRAVIVPSVPAQKQKKRRNRVKKSKNAVVYSPVAPVSSQIQMPGFATSGGNRQIVMSRELKASLNLNKITPEGVRFLKCAFSAPDFDGSGTYGVPDEYCGKSIAVKHRLTQPGTFNSTNDVYILILPTPGVAFYTAFVPAGTSPTAATVWTGTNYSDFVSFFVAGGAGATALVMNKFRFVSQHFEIVNTTNANSWSGSIQAWKMPVQVTIGDNSTFTVPKRVITGLNATAATDQDMYSGGFNLGVYAGSYNKGSTDWGFSPIMTSVYEIPDGTAGVADWGQVLGSPGYFIPGFDNNFESTCIKVSGVTGTNSAILRAWACVEYQFVPGNPMYEMQNLKFTCDQKALELYRYIVMNLPPGVSAFDNANFWSRVLNIIKSISGGMSLMPGPYGLAATGVNSIARAIEELTI